jgi:hypothetical protein
MQIVGKLALYRFRVRCIQPGSANSPLCLQQLARLSLGSFPADGSFDGTLYHGNALHLCLFMIHAKVRIPLSHLCCPVSQEFSDRVQIHPGHNQSTGEGMAIAMPRIVFCHGRGRGFEPRRPRHTFQMTYLEMVKLDWVQKGHEKCAPFAPQFSDASFPIFRRSAS